jgi:hypothetical protein
MHPSVIFLISEVGCIKSLRRNFLAATMAHTCNPSYLGGEDQEDYGLRPAKEENLVRPHLTQ